MRGGISVPYPAPCGGWNNRIYLNGPYKHFRTAEDGFDRYVFDAKVPDYRNNTSDNGGPDPDYNAAGIDPYPRFAGYCDGGRPECDGMRQAGCGYLNCNQCYNAYGSPTAPITAFGAVWIAPRPLDVDGNPYVDPNYFNFSNPEPLHWTHTPGDKKDFSRCIKSGFKNVLARRSFHGNWGKLSENVGGWSGGDIDPTTGAACLIPLEYNPTPDQTKYTSATVTVHMEKNDGTLKEFDATAHAGVGILTSVKTADWSFVGDPSFGVVDIQCPLDRPVDPPIGWGSTAQSLAAAIFSMNRNTAVGYFFKSLTGYETVTKLSGSQWKGENSDGSYKIIICNFIDSFGVETFTPGAYGGGGTTSSESLSLSNTSADYSWSWSSGTSTQGVSLNCTFGDPHTLDDVADDAEDNLLAVWHLDDDAECPWDQGGVLSVGPLVTRREGGDTAMELHMDLNTPSEDPTTWTAKVYTDPNADIYDGAILGGPKPAGYEGTFDYRWENWKACLPTSEDALKILQWFRDSTGATDIQVAGRQGGRAYPRNATQFPSNIQAFLNRPGAWIAVNDPTTSNDHYNNGGTAQKGGVWVCKYAEILELWPSQNFARPAGEDRFAYDETKVYAVGDDLTTPATGGTFTPRDLYGNAITIADTSGVWGGPAVGGFYNISQAGTLVTLGAKVFNMPTGWKSKSGDDAACFGKLRWPTAPGILGKAANTWFSNESPIMMITDALPYVVTGDQVDISGITGITAANGTFTITRISDREFTLNGSAGNLSALYIAPPSPAGLLVAGNIDINNRPLVLNGDDVSTVYSMTLEEGGLFILIPRVNDVDRTVMSEADAIAHYHSTGKHLGKFDTNEHCETYAVQLHDQQEATYFHDEAIVVSHNQKYYFDTDRPKGDFVTLEFTLDTRTNAERARLLASVNGCTGAVMAAPAANNGYASFNQAQGCLPFTPCAPKVVCYSPNGETFENGVTYPPARPTLDYRYGTLALFYVQQTMTDLLYQPPHSPVTVSDSLTDSDFDPANDRLEWKEDDGTCSNDSIEVQEGGGAVYKKFFSHHPMVEARLTVRNNYGPAQNETPALPAGIQIGWLSPVDHVGDGVAYIPGIVGFNEDGSLSGTTTPWGVKATLCANAKSGCRWADIYRNMLVGCPGIPSDGGPMSTPGSSGTGSAQPFGAGTETIGAGDETAGAGL